MIDNQPLEETVCEQTNNGAQHNSNAQTKLIESTSSDIFTLAINNQVQEPSQTETPESEIDLPKGSISYITNLDSFKVDFDYDELVVNIVKAIPNRRFDPQARCWYVNPHITSLANLRLLMR